MITFMIPVQTTIGYNYFGIFDIMFTSCPAAYLPDWIWKRLIIKRFHV